MQTKAPAMKADKNQTFLPQPFPRWINQWAPLIFLGCILLPAVPLTCIRQPVYVRVPFEFTGGDGEAAIRVKVSKAVADWNAAGEK